MADRYFQNFDGSAPVPSNVLSLSEPTASKVPVFVDSPHSGCVYPDDFKPLLSMQDLRKVEDAYVDGLFDDAPSHGIGLLSALFPRSYIDPNRAETDLDPAMIEGAWNGPMRPTDKTRMGHGLVWSRYPSDRPLYPCRLPASVVRHRIEHYWRPYHDCLRARLDDLHRRFGMVWHLDCHSMPASSSPYVAGRPGARADVVLGDRDGTSCGAGFTLFVGEQLRDLGYSVRVNDPYRGAELVRAYGNPPRNRHSLQIEINRGLYMNEATLEKTDGFDRLKDDLGNLLGRIASYATATASTAAAAE